MGKAGCLHGGHSPRHLVTGNVQGAEGMRHSEGKVQRVDPLSDRVKGLTTSSQSAKWSAVSATCP